MPVAHEGGRYLVDNKAHQRAFTGYVIEHRGVTVYFPGDTAYRQEVFTAVARRFPRIDLALLPIGPRTPTAMMRPSHLDPLQALQAAADLDAQQVVPIHFGTFQHSYDEPGALEALFDRAAARDARFRGRVQRLLIGERRVLLPGW